MDLINLTGTDMLTIAGVGTVTSIVVQLFWRKFLAIAFNGAGSAGDIDDRVKSAAYGLAMNVLAFLTAWGFAYVAQALFVAVGYASLFESLIVALSAAVWAVGVGEVVPNASRVLRIT